MITLTAASKSQPSEWHKQNCSWKRTPLPFPLALGGTAVGGVTPNDTGHAERAREQNPKPPSHNEGRRRLSLRFDRCGHFPLCSVSSLPWGHDGAEPYAIVTALRRYVVAAHPPAEERAAAPIAAAKHAARARSRTTRVGLRGTGVNVIPIPTPFGHVPSHVIQPIPVCVKVAGWTGVRENAVVERRVIAKRRAQVVRVTSRVVVRLTPRNAVAPRKPLPAHTAPPGLPRFRVRRQPIPMRIRLRVGRARPGLIHGRQSGLVVVAGLPPLLLRPPIAPLHAVPPVDRLHRMRGRLPGTGVLVAVPVAAIPRLHRVPQALGHQILRS